MDYLSSHGEEPKENKRRILLLGAQIPILVEGDIGFLLYRIPLGLLIMC